MLPSRHRLRRSSELQRVRQKGRRWHHPLITLLVYTQTPAEDRAESPPPSRFAFVAGRMVGGAVQRNRTKRQLREVVHHMLPRLLPGYDCIVIARPPSAEAKYDELEAGMELLFAKADLWQ